GAQALRYDVTATFGRWIENTSAPRSIAKCIDHPFGDRAIRHHIRRDAMRHECVGRRGTDRGDRETRQAPSVERRLTQRRPEELDRGLTREHHMAVHW